MSVQLLFLQIDGKRDFSNRWDYLAVYFNRQKAIKQAKNSPKKIDAQGILNLIKACPHNLQRFVLISSAGVERKNQFPFKILVSVQGVTKIW